MHEGFTPPHHSAPTWSAPQVALPYAPVRERRSGTAVASLVMSAAALLGVLLIGAWLLFSGAPLPGDDATPLTGQIASARPGSALPGAELSDAVRQRIEEDGGDVSGMACPQTPSVDQGVVTLCHGTISGASWAVVVYFEDAQGRFTLNPL